MLYILYIYIYNVYFSGVWRFCNLSDVVQKNLPEVSQMTSKFFKTGNTVLNVWFSVMNHCVVNAQLITGDYSSLWDQ